MSKAVKRGYDKLFAEHYKDYASLFNRVHFTLAEGTDAQQHKPTNERLADYRKGVADPQLETLYYQYGRYLLIASSRPGNLPANLQGMWHNNVDGPWRVDYHNNINLQMNYWPALPTNLTECTEPLTNFIRLLENPVSAQPRLTGAQGVGLPASRPTSSALRRRSRELTCRGTTTRWLHRGSPHTCGTIMTTHAMPSFASHCLPVDEGLRPLLRGLSVAKARHRHPDGRTLYLARTRTDRRGYHLYPCRDTRDIGGLHSSCQCAWHRPGRGGPLAKDTATPRALQIGRYGQLMEWSRDIDDPNDEHRHVNHLFGLHPGHTISPLTTPALANAARVVLEHRGDGATGWSMGWKLNQWARLHDGNHSYILYGNLLKNGTADNLWDIHPPFQIDGNFGGTAGVTEMLLQSHAGCLDLLPSLPDAWPEGSISGLRARGNFGVSLSWTGGQLKQAVITSGSGGMCHLRYGNHTLDLPTHKGRSYTITLNQGKLVWR